MQKTKIEWVKNLGGSQGYSWNPIKGICPVGCWYCYARKMYERFAMNPEIRLGLDELMSPYPQKPSKIFVCSTFELFHPLADPYRNNVFKHIELAPQHVFIILTKMPERIDRPMPPNVWLGVSVTGVDDDWKRVDELIKHRSTVRFISLEPFLGLISYPLPRTDWIICGRLTGHGKKYDPTRTKIEALVEDARDAEVPIFMKNNLADIWGKPLIQEYPIT